MSEREDVFIHATTRFHKVLFSLLFMFSEG